MRVLVLVLTLLCPMLLEAASASFKKVLPHYLDREGRHTLSPSLFERDAYQAHLRENPELRSGLRFDVQWKGSRKVPLMMQVELRGTRDGTATTAVLQTPLKGRRWFSRWSSVALSGQDYEGLGELLAWRATIWTGETLLDEERSFLW